MATFGDDMILGGEVPDQGTPPVQRGRKKKDGNFMGFFDNEHGFLGGHQDWLFGERPQAEASGAFQNVGNIGQTFSRRLLERLNTPVEQSQAFFHGSKAIRDALTGEAAEARQRLGDTATAGGFMDSGAVLEGDLDIARGKSVAMAQAVNDLFLQLEDRRDRDVLPFLSGAAGESLGITQTNIEGRKTDMDFASSIIDSVLGI